ncbi:MAG: hypothetical protein QXO37_06920 [Candidatus Nitrosocaldaceae archaeon]
MSDNLFSIRISKSDNPVANSDLQLLVAPYIFNKRFIIKKIVINNTINQRGTLKIWDKDLSGTTSLGSGSNSSPIFAFGIEPNPTSGVGTVTTTYTEDEIPNIIFNAGIAYRVDIASTNIAIEVEQF